MDGSPEFSVYNPVPTATQETAEGVRHLTRQNAEVIQHLDATVTHLEAIAEDMRATSRQNRTMVRLSIAMLSLAILTLITTVTVPLVA